MALRSGEWSDHEVTQLKELVALGEGIDFISKETRRRPSSVRGKLNSLNLEAPSLRRVPGTGPLPLILNFLLSKWAFGALILLIGVLLYILPSGVRTAMMLVLSMMLVLLGILRLRMYREDRTSLWNERRVGELQNLARQGESLETIALSLSFGFPNYMLSASSVRSKLVNLGEYNTYQERYLEKLGENYKAQAGKLHKLIGTRLQIQESSFFDTPTTFLVKHKDEADQIEWKETFSRNTETNKYKDENIRYAALREIAGFLNTRDGILLIGVKEKKPCVGTRCGAWD